MLVRATDGVNDTTIALQATGFYPTHTDGDREHTYVRAKLPGDPESIPIKEAAVRLPARLAAAATVAALLTAAAPAAQASASPRSACYGGRLCLYAGFDFNRGQLDHWRDFVRDDANLVDNRWLNWDYSDSWHSMNNETSSVRNRVGCPATLWQHAYFTGAHSTFGHGASDAFLANNAIGNNSTSSVDIWCR